MSEPTPPPTPAPLLTQHDLPEIIRRYRAGESMLTIAHDASVSSRQLYNWIMKELGPDYEAIQTECLINRIADADAQLEKATNVFQIARAREIARYARMDFERRRPQLYGPKSEVKSDHKITVMIARETPQPVVIEAQAEGSHE